MGLIQFIVTISSKYGTLGIFIGAILENIGVPFANSAQVLGSGYLIANHKATFWGLILAGTAGNIIGSTIGYGIGYFLGNQIRKWKHGHIFKADSTLQRFIDKYGNASVFFGQLYGTTRTFISIPAGMLRMKYKPFIVYTALGGFLFALFVTAFSFIIRDAYYHYIFPFLGISFGAAGLLLGLVILITHISYKNGDKLKGYLKRIFK
jgi:membrane protein DedA with SNARE-associated domain